MPFRDGLRCVFDRFCKRRGAPRLVVSDNGRNFASAESELRDALEAIDRGQVVTCTATKQHTS